MVLDFYEKIKKQYLYYKQHKYYFLSVEVNIKLMCLCPATQKMSCNEEKNQLLPMYFHMLSLNLRRESMATVTFLT